MLELDGKRVLEIGCGLALSSIVLQKMGVDITASDYHPLAREFLDRNILRNKLLPIKFLTGNWDTRNPLLGEFDLIIGSDVLYEPAHSESVSQFIDRHSSVDVEVVIVDPGRGTPPCRATRSCHPSIKCMCLCTLTPSDWTGLFHLEVTAWNSTLERSTIENMNSNQAAEVIKSTLVQCSSEKRMTGTPFSHSACISHWI